MGEDTRMKKTNCECCDMMKNKKANVQERYILDDIHRLNMKIENTNYFTEALDKQTAKGFNTARIRDWVLFALIVGTYAIWWFR